MSTKISKLREGMRRVNVTAVVESVSEAREVRSRFTGRMLKVATAIIYDDTGKIDLVLWNEQISQISPGDKIRVENGYVSSFRGRKQLNVGRYGKIVKI